MNKEQIFNFLNITLVGDKLRFILFNEKHTYATFYRCHTI